jgi:hypothetical protein
MRERSCRKTCSLDTIGNAYFSRVMHAAPRGLRRLLTITSAFHMPRAEAVFRWVYGLEGPGGDFVFRFEATADTGLSAAALEARRRKESERMAALPALEARIGTLAELHDWLFSEHRAYAVSGYAEGGRDEQAGGAILESY